jgi:cysteine synthase
MKHSITIGILGALFLVAAAPAAMAKQMQGIVFKTEFVGFTYSKLPNYVRSLGGMVVPAKDNKEYAVSWVEKTDPMTKKKEQLLWLEQITHRVQGEAHYRVLAVVRVPRYGKSDVLAMGSCGSGDVSGGGDGRTVAIVRQENKKILSKVLVAWRADPEHQRFVFPDAHRVRCLNEGPGD